MRLLDNIYDCAVIKFDGLDASIEDDFDVPAWINNHLWLKANFFRQLWCVPAAIQLS